MNNEKNSPKHEKAKVRKVKEKRDKELGFFSRLKAGFLKLSTTKKALVISLSCIILAILIIVGTGLGIYLDFKKQYNEIYTEITDEEIIAIKPIDEKIVNIALFGIDSRSSGYSGNSDSIMILSVNTGNGDIKLISVMRDSLVKMVKQNNGKTPNPNKINSAYARGGATYAIKVLNENFGLDIQKAITVNFFGMAEIVDAVGGVEINVLKREINAKYGLNDNIREQARKSGKKAELVTEPGLQKLNGMQAVAWARIRSVSNEQGTANDFGRTDRQRIVMEKLLEKVLAMNMSWGEFYDFAKTLFGYMKIEGVDFDFDTAASIAFKVLSKKGSFEQTRVPQTKYIIDADFRPKSLGSCVYYDLDYATKIIHAMIYEGISDKEYMEKNGVEKNKWYTGPMASSSSNKGDKEDSEDDLPSDEPVTPPTEDPSNPGQGDGTGEDEIPVTPENPGTTPPGEEENPDGEGNNENENQGDGDGNGSEPTTPPTGADETPTE